MEARGTIIKQSTGVRCFLCSRHCYECFTCIHSFRADSKPIKEELAFSSLTAVETETEKGVLA